MSYATPTQSYTKEANAADAGASHAYSILHFGYVVLPLIAGVDKFFGTLTNWDKYLAPTVISWFKLDPHLFMMGAGVVEILAALVVVIKPRLGAYILAIWFAGIIANLALHTVPYWDVAARDFGLLLGALALGSLSAWAKQKPTNS